MEPVRFGLVLLPKFSQLGIYSVTEPMRAANGFRPGSMEWQLLSLDGNSVQASNGEDVSVSMPLRDAGKFDYVALVCGDDPLANTHPDYGRFLRRCRQQGSQIGAFDVAQFLLAEMGLLHNRRATVHWEYADAFRERYFRVDLRETLFERHGDIFTCAGATAGLDFMLELVRESLGADIARKIASRFLVEHVRTAEERQAQEVTQRYGTYDTRLITALQLMEEHLEEPLSIAEIVRSTRTSQRSLERAFHRHFGVTPLTYYLKMRFARAQSLLKQTDLSVSEISIMSGFKSPTQFGRAYRKIMDETPSTTRAKTRTP